MKTKNLNLEFYIFDLTYDNKIYRSNILNSEELINRITKSYKKNKYKTFEDLRDDLRTYFMWRYWSKSEYEYIVSGLLQNNDCFDGHKLDVFYQIELNLNTITELIIKHMELEINVPEKYSEDKKFWEKIEGAIIYK